MVEAEIYDTNNKRSLDLSKLKKERCLNFLKIRLLCFKVYIKRTKYLIELADPQVSVQNFRRLTHWHKTLTQNFPAVKNNQCPNSGFLYI